MARSRFVAIGIVAAVVLAGGAAWLLDRGPAPDVRPDGAAPPPPAAVPLVPAPPPVESRPAPLRGTGIVTGRLVRGAPTNAVAGEVAVTFAGRAPVAVATGERGVFRIDGLPLLEPFTLEASSPGLVPFRHPGLVIPMGGVLELGDLPMGAGTTLEVLVTRGAMEPAAGVVVTLRRPPMGDDEGWISGTERTPLPDGSWTTDGAGRALLTGTAPGWWRVRAAGGGLATEEVQLFFRDGESLAPLRIHLTPSHSLAGTVRRRDGTPVAGAEVLAGAAGKGVSGFRGWTGTITGPDGIFRLDGIGEGAHDVSVRLQSRSVTTAARVLIPDVARIDITLEPGITLRGSVVEDRGGAPVAGARVRARASGWGGRPESTTATAVSGSDGRFTLAELHWTYHLSVLIRGAGFVPAEFPGKEEHRFLMPGDVVEREVRLVRGGAVRGTVKDAEGRPLAGALVLHQPELVPGGPSFLAFHASRSTRAEADGAYHLEHCVPGKGTLAVLAPGFTDTESAPRGARNFLIPKGVSATSPVEVAEGEEARGDFVLSPGGVVEGVVRDDAGGPAKGLLVEIAGRSGESLLVQGSPTDEEGRFRIEGVPAGASLVVRARGPGARGDSARFDLAPGGTATGISVEVRPVHAVSGILRSREGTPLLDPRLLLAKGALSAGTGARGPTGSLFDRTCVPDRDGSFRFEQVEPGEYGIVAFAGGCAPAVLPGLRVEEGSDVHGLEILLGPGRRLSGTVVEAGGAPVAGASILLAGNPPCLGEDDVVRQVTGPDGRFALRDLAEGSVGIIVRCAGWSEAVRTVRTGTMDMVISLVPGLRIAGRVVDGATGRAMPGIVVIVADPAGEGALARLRGEVPLAKARTDAEGRFSADGLAEGVYSVSVDRGAGQEQHSPLVVRGVKAGTEDLRLVLEQGLRIAGRVVFAGGGPVRGRVGGGGAPRAGGGGRGGGEGGGGRTEEDGTFEVRGLPAGRYVVKVGPEGRLPLPGMGTASPYVAVEIPSVEAGTSGLVIRIEQGLTISGRVLDESGNPPGDSGSVVVTCSEGQETGSFKREFCLVDGRSGVFATSALPPGRTYDLEADNFAGTTPGHARGVAPGTRDLVILVSRGAAISGRLLLADGRPAPEGVPVEARAKGSPESSEAKSGKDGGFRITGLVGTEFQVVAGGDGSDFAPKAAAGTCRPGDSDVEIVLDPCFTISGVLVDGEGRPLRSVRLMAVQGDRPRNYGFTETAGDGTFLVKGLARGKVELSTGGGRDSTELGTFDVPSSDLRVVLRSR